MIFAFLDVEIQTNKQVKTRPARGGDRGWQNAQSVQRGPEILVNICIVYQHFMFVVNERCILAHYPLIVVIEIVM